MQKKNQYDDKQLLKLLDTDSELAIDAIFRKYYTVTCRNILRIIPDEQIAEDLAQDVFYELWKKKNKLKINLSLSAYLKRAAVNKSLNFIRDQRIDFRNAPPKKDLKSNDIEITQKIDTQRLEKDIERAIDQLPDKCRLVFVLSRYENMSYQQIADQLNISIKTVENQISKALKTLRKSLASYLPELLIVICNYIPSLL